MPLYRLFGLSLASDLPLTWQLPAGRPPPDLRFTAIAGEPITLSAEPVYQSPLVDDQGASVLGFYPLSGQDVLRFPGEADFILGRDRIDARFSGTRARRLLELRLLGPVLALWLERAGLPALHAAAVTVGGRAVVFLGGNRGGKSSLAAALMEAGYPLLTDDILPVEERGGVWYGRAGYPQMRLWPPEVARFLGTATELPRVHPAVAKRRLPVGEGGFGFFDGEARPLGCIYLPVRRPADRGGPAIEIEPVTPRDALIELVRGSFLARLVEAAGWQPRRLELLARLAGNVPVRQLSYPQGLEHLQPVRQAVLEDLARGA